MRFAFVGCDRNLSVFDEFLAAGWEPVKVFSLPATDPLGRNQALFSIADIRKIKTQLRRFDVHDLEELAASGCEALVVGSYNFRIPDWQPYLRYAINFHPSPLPYGRGPYPIVNAILHGYQSWAVTCHKIDVNFDTGPILETEEFRLLETDTHESLSVKVQMASSRLARRIASHFEQSWNQAQAQDDGDYWPLFSLEQRTIFFTSSVSTIMRQLRAFGRLGCFARLGNHVVQVDAGYAWQESHPYPPGQPVHYTQKTIVLACADGYVAFSEWNAIPIPENTPVPAEQVECQV